MNYISLFSSAGLGSYGLTRENFDCIASSELIERRLEVQKYNKIIENEDGYILGDITSKENKEKLYDVTEKYLKEHNQNDVDIVHFTPPCQGMSVANHKKNDGTIEQNSLVVEALEIVNEIQPKIFIAENVRRFMNTTCIDHNKKVKIHEAFENWLGDSYDYETKIINFKEYGANSSRTRTLVIGVRKDLSDLIKPIDLFPNKEKEKTLKDIIGHLPSLSKMGEISENDIYHSFRPYREDMRNWIRDLKEGESAFGNSDPLKQPHQIINGEYRPNVRKNGDKYTRQYWDKIAPCVHTRNDILASQSTVHPDDDRVFSIRELMIFMNVPEEFKWTEESLEELNALSYEEKYKFLKSNAINIRQCLGEGIPTVIMEKIARNIKNEMMCVKSELKEYSKAI